MVTASLVSGTPVASGVATPVAGAATVTAADRMSFTIFLAGAIHAAIILGITFTFSDRGPSTHTMEVTLAQQRSENQPDKVDYLAAFNQIGSGSLADKAEITSPTESEFLDTEIRETAPQPQVSSTPGEVQPTKPVITTTGKSRLTATATVDLVEDKPPDATSPVEKTLLQRSLEIASLQARLDEQRQVYAKRPRIKRLTSLATAASADANYLNSWRRKVEMVGNLNYPAEARKRQLFGSLRLLVAVRPDGSLKSVELLESSGSSVLDDAAIRIVELAAPFAPFPDELRETTDVLEIIRTWQFRKNSSMRSM
jgi:periplasmic protein TonB